MPFRNFLKQIVEIFLKFSGARAGQPPAPTNRPTKVFPEQKSWLGPSVLYSLIQLYVPSVGAGGGTSRRNQLLSFLKALHADAAGCNYVCTDKSLNV